MKTGVRILVVDDESSLRGVVSQVLSEEGHEVTVAESGEEALEAIRKNPYPLVITDIRMEGMNGIRLLQEVKRLHPDTQVVIMTSHASLDTAIQALRAGAYDYLIKPFETLDVVTVLVERVVEKIRLMEDNRRLLEDLRQKNAELERVNRIIRELAVRDGLTGLHNHRYFHEALRKEIDRCRGNGRTFSLIFLDVDFFKQYNDRYGHLMGDQVLMSIGQLLKEQIKEGGIVARYGGEEFVLLLPETPKEKASRLAEAVRKRIEGYTFAHAEETVSKPVTVSLGVGAFPEDAESGSDLIRVVDQALYGAKGAGRNQVCLANKARLSAA